MQKNASQKCKKDAGAKTQCKKMQITGLICFLFAFFCIVVLPFFFCFCLVFFCLFVHLPRLLQLFPEIMFVQLVPGLICFFFSFFLLFAQVFQLFPKSCLSSWPLVWFVVFLARFCMSIFCSFQSCFFQLCVFLLFLHLFFLLLPRLHSSFACFLLYFYFFPSWKFTRISAIRQHNVYGASFTKEERHEPPSSRQDTTKGGWELITFSTYKEPPDVDPISYIHIFLGPQPHNAHDPKIVSGCTGCK